MSNRRILIEDKDKMPHKGILRYENPDDYYQARIQRMLNLLQPPQKKTLRAYAEFCSLEGKKIKSVWNYINVLFALGKFLNKPFEKATKKDLIEYIKTLQGHAPTSLANWKTVIRKFYKWSYGGDYIKKRGLFPPVVDDSVFETKKKPKAQHIKSKKDLLTKDEFLLMVKASNVRDRAVLMMLYEGGFRAGEIISLNKNSIEFDSNGARVWVEKSKTQTRYVRLVDAVPHVKAWLNQHKYEEEDAPLFYSIGSFYGKRLTIKAPREIVIRSAKKAGIKKHVFAHMLRHIAVTHCKHDLQIDVDDIAKRHGINPMTVRSVYLHYDDSDVDKAYLSAKGGESDEDKVKRQEELKKTAPKKCENCGHINSWDSHYCEKCKTPVDLKTALDFDKTRKLADSVIEKTLVEKGKIDRDSLKAVIKDMIKSGELKI